MEQFLEEFLQVLAVGLLAEAHSKYYIRSHLMNGIHLSKIRVLFDKVILFIAMKKSKSFNYNKNNAKDLTKLRGNDPTPVGKVIKMHASQRKDPPPAFKSELSLKEGMFSSPNSFKQPKATQLNMTQKLSQKNHNTTIDYFTKLNSKSRANVDKKKTLANKSQQPLQNQMKKRLIQYAKKPVNKPQDQTKNYKLNIHRKPKKDREPKKESKPSKNPKPQIVPESNKRTKKDPQRPVIFPQQLPPKVKEVIAEINKCRHLAKIEPCIKQLDKYLYEIEIDKRMIEERIIPIIQTIEECFALLSKCRIGQQRAQAEVSQSSDEEQEDLRLFLSNILYNYQDYREYLHQVLKNHFGPIKKTNLLYRFDQHNKANIHKYIDRKKHLLFVIETTKNYILAAYTEAPFEPQSTVVGRAIIFSLTNRRFYVPKKDKKAITYDQMYVIFGNSDLRIHESELLVNLGLNTCNYQSRGERAHSLLGENNNTMTTIKALQVFEVIYE